VGSAVTVNIIFQILKVLKFIPNFRLIFKTQRGAPKIHDSVPSLQAFSIAEGTIK